MIRFALITLLAATAASAQFAPAAAPEPAVATTPAKTPATATAAKPKTDRMICENQEGLGSRLQGHRVCKSASQWAAERRDAQDEIQRAQTNRNGPGSNN